MFEDVLDVGESVVADACCDSLYFNGDGGQVWGVVGVACGCVVFTGW